MRETIGVSPARAVNEGGLTRPLDRDAARPTVLADLDDPPLRGAAHAVGRHGGALAACAPTISPRCRSGAHRSASRARLGGRRRRDPRLREPGRRGQPQRRAHGGAARRPARSTVPGVTVNRLCASGLEAVGQRRARDRRRRGGARDRRRRREHDARAVRDGQGRRARSRATPKLEDTTLGWRFVNPRMEARYGIDSMGQTAENVAARVRHRARGPGRVRAAQPAARRRAARQGGFAAEIVPVDGAAAQGRPRVVVGRRASAPRDDAREARQAQAARSRAAARSPRATPRASTTAPARCCSRPRRRPRTPRPRAARARRRHGARRRRAARHGHRPGARHRARLLARAGLTLERSTSSS